MSAQYVFGRLEDLNDTDAIDLLDLMRRVRDDLKDDASNFDRLKARTRRHCVLMARDAFGRIMGTLTLKFFVDDLSGIQKAAIEDLVVIETRRGIGTRLFEMAVAAARERGAEELVLVFRSQKTGTMRFIEALAEKNDIADFSKQSMRSVICRL